MKTDKQHQVLKYLSTVESATLKDIYNNVKFGYYHNWNKHLGELLSRMVKRGFIERVKKGTFRKLRNQSFIEVEKNQTSLF